MIELDTERRKEEAPSKFKLAVSKKKWEHLEREIDYAIAKVRAD